jgi:hypothetical protein
MEKNKQKKQTRKNWIIIYPPFFLFFFLSRSNQV